MGKCRVSHGKFQTAAYAVHLDGKLSRAPSIEYVSMALGVMQMP